MDFSAYTSVCGRYRLLAGKPPFFSRNPQEFLSCVAQARFEMPERLSADAKDLIDMILQPDPANRPSCSKILKHPWFDGPIKEPALARYVVRTPLHTYARTHARTTNCASSGSTATVGW